MIVIDTVSRHPSNAWRLFHVHLDHPSPDDKHERLKALAEANAVSVNKLMDELATVALVNFDARVRIETRAARGRHQRALAWLDKLDRAD